MNVYQGSTRKKHLSPQKFGRRDQGPKYLHNLKLHNLEQQQICKEDLHGSNSQVENTPGTIIFQYKISNRIQMYNKQMKVKYSAIHNRIQIICDVHFPEEYYVCHSLPC